MPRHHAAPDVDNFLGSWFGARATAHYASSCLSCLYDSSSACYSIHLGRCRIPLIAAARTCAPLRAAAIPTAVLETLPRSGVTLEYSVRTTNSGYNFCALPVLLSLRTANGLRHAFDSVAVPSPKAWRAGLCRTTGKDDAISATDHAQRGSPAATAVCI